MDTITRDPRLNTRRGELQETVSGVMKATKEPEIGGVLLTTEREITEFYNERRRCKD